MARHDDLVPIAPEMLAEIYRRLGGTRAVAERLGLTRGAPQRWRDRSQIPRARLEALRALLRQVGAPPAG